MALGTDQVQRNFLGSWAAKDRSDVYVKTAIKVVEKLQMQVASCGAQLLRGGLDDFGEEHSLNGLIDFLVAAAWTGSGPCSRCSCSRE